MDIDSTVVRLGRAGDLKEAIIISAALWSVVAIRNTEPELYERLKNTYGQVLDEINPE